AGFERRSKRLKVGRGRRRSFANRSVGRFTFILRFRHFHIHRATVHLIRSGGSGRGPRSVSPTRGDHACEFFLRVRLSQASARRSRVGSSLSRCVHARRRRGRPQRIYSLGAPRGAAGSDRGPTWIVRVRASGRRTRGAVPLRPTLCQKQIAQPPLPVSLYKPLVFRRFRAAARGGGGFLSPRLYAPWGTAPPRRAEKAAMSEKGPADAQDTQRPGICANGECPIALTTGSQPSSNLGLGAGAGAGAISAGRFTALRLLVETSGIRSLLSVRLTIGALRAIDGAAVVEETSRPTRKIAMAKTAPPQPTRYPE